MQWLRAAVLLALSAARAFPADTYLILPFYNLTGSPSLDWVGESVSEAVRESFEARGVLTLDRGERQDVLRRLSIRPYAELTLASLIKLGAEIDAEQVIYGEVRMSPLDESASKTQRQVSLSCRILDLRHMKRSAPLSTAGPLEQLTPLQNHLAWLALNAVDPQTSLSEAEFRQSRPQVRIDAMESYIRGLQAVNPENKLKLFQQAYKIDSRFSQPCFQLGKLFWEKKNYKAAAEWFQKVGNADVRFREAYFLLGLCLYYTGAYPAAEKAFQYIAQEVPLNEVYNNLAAAQSREDSPQAAENFRRAIEGDPSDPAYHFNLGYALWRQGNFPAAADQFRAVLDRTPEDSQAMTMLGKCLRQNGPKSGEPSPGMERVKENYDESAWRQLKAVLAPKK